MKILNGFLSLDGRLGMMGAANRIDMLHEGRRTRATDLRHKTRYDLVLTRGKRPSENAYTLFEREDNGQMRIA
jgi:hypothetical protein